MIEIPSLQTIVSLYISKQYEWSATMTVTVVVKGTSQNDELHESSLSKHILV